MICQRNSVSKLASCGVNGNQRRAILCFMAYLSQGQLPCAGSHILRCRIEKTSSSSTQQLDHDATGLFLLGGTTGSLCHLYPVYEGEISWISTDQDSDNQRHLAWPIPTIQGNGDCHDNLDCRYGFSITNERLRSQRRIHS